MRKHTPGPWKLEPYDPCLAGEDFQWGGIWAGPVILDGINYGQPPYTPIKPETLERMEADARLIAAAPDLLDALLMVLDDPNALDGRPRTYEYVHAAIAKATGEKA